MAESPDAQTHEATGAKTHTRPATTNTNTPSSYQAVVVSALSSTSSDAVALKNDLPMLVPSEEELLVEVHAAGLAFPDLLIMQGKHMMRMEPPYTPGAEVCGRVVQVGTGACGDFRVGDWVFGATKSGGLAEVCLMSPEDVYRLPPGVEPVSAAGFELNYGTAWHGLSDLANLRSGETLLVLGASGGIGSAALGIGKALGARVVAVASSEKKRQACVAAGADVTVGYGRPTTTTATATAGSNAEEYDRGAGFKAALVEAGVYGSVDVVFDPVGGAWSEAALRSLGWGGRFVVIGFAAGGTNPKAAIPVIPLNLALLNERQVLGCFWGAWKAMDGNRGNRKNIEAMMELLRRGDLRRPVTSRAGEFRLGDFARAFDRMTNRSAIGKVCVTVRDGRGDYGGAAAAAASTSTALPAKL